MDPDRLLFIHIPKTGGISIRKVLEPYLFSSRWDNIHLTATDFISRFGRDVYNRLHKFTVVRNPYDRIVSYYHFLRVDKYHKTHIARSISLSAFIGWACEGYIPAQHYHISHNGQVRVDTILKFENLAQDWRDFAEMFSIDTELPHLNAVKHKDWRELLSERDMTKVRKSFEIDFRMFEYD